MRGVSVAVCMVLALASLDRGTARAQGLAPETIYYNGKIVTVNERFDIVQALGVRRGQIAAVGSNDAIRALASPDTRLVDLQGKTMLPGLYDNHIHLNPEPPAIEVESPNDLARMLRKRAAELPKGEWIVLWLKRPYWHMKNPTRWELDEIVADHPVVLDSTHKMSVNSLALQKAGVTKDSPDPKGGWIVRDQKREPIGILFERPAKALVTRVMPPAARLNESDALENLQRALEKFPRMGVTSVNVAGMAPGTFRWLQDLYARSGSDLPRLTLQPRLWPGYDAADAAVKDIEALSFRTGLGDERLKLGAIKIGIDGGIAAPDFWTIEPYNRGVEYAEKGPFDDPEFRGVDIVPKETLYRVAKRARDLGWQLGIHAIGDAAVAMTVDVLERILQENPRRDHRHYLHHVTIKPPEETLNKIAKLGIIVATQPNFTYFNTAFMLAAVKGPRLDTQNPQKSLLTHGIRLSYGSDDLPHGPMLGIWAAVTRKGYDGKVYGAGEAVSVEDAIRFYTMGSAYMTFDEQNQGSLEVGKVADMVVLSEDILTVDPDRIRDIAIERTIIGGKEVFAGRHVEPYFQTLPSATASR